MAEDLMKVFGEYDKRFVILLIKYHESRAVLDLNKQIINKSIKRYSKNLTFTVDKDYSGCIDGIWEAHGECWLYDELVKAFKNLFLTDNYKTRVHTIELWDDETGHLVAGEIGYIVGGLYTSLSGFKRKDSLGSVQLAVLGKFLKSCGIDYWDLGMVMPYKLNIGAEILSRNNFVDLLNIYKDNKKEIHCPQKSVNDILSF